MNTGTLFAALESIPDHRTRKGRRFPLAAILAISLAAMLSGANDLMAIFRWGRRLSPIALQALGVDKKRRKAPCHATYHYVFQSVSAEELASALGCLVTAADGLGHVAIDGKRLRGSQHADEPRRAYVERVLEQAAGRRRIAGGSAQQRRGHRGAGTDQIATARRCGRHRRCRLHVQAHHRCDPKTRWRLLPVC